MKKFLKPFIVIMIVVLSLFVVAGCGKSYTITLNSNGGSECQSVATDGKSVTAIPHTPTKEGYDFGGWFLDDGVWQQPFTANFLLDKPLSSDMTLYAKWVAVEYAVAVGALVNGSITVDKVTANIGDTVTLTVTPSEGYQLVAGSLKYNDTAISGNTFVMPASDVRITASFALISDDIIVDGMTYKRYGANATLIKGVNNANVEIPASITYKGATYAVTSIGNLAFYNCSALASITLPQGVTSIGEGAFSGCSALTDIAVDSANTTYKDVDGNLYSKDGTVLMQYAIGKSESEFIVSAIVTNIGDSAFYGCRALTSITIPQGVTSIGNNAFYGCSSLTIFAEASEPSGWNYNGCPVVWDCKNNGVASDGCLYITLDGVKYSLKDGVATVARQSSAIKVANIASSITYDNISYNVVSIDNYAFNDCLALTTVTIADGNALTSIGIYAFGGCSALASITLPQSLKNIDTYAFVLCSSLVSITLPQSLTNIGGSAFGDCIALTSVTLPQGLKSIGRAAFNGCRSLANITIPDGVTSIGENAFSGCSFKSITIPASVTSIGYRAFMGCRSLASITVEPANTTYKSIEGNLYSYDGTALMQYAIGKTASAFSVPVGVTSIGESGFDGCSLASITIPVGVTSIGDYAFRGCTSLASITLSATVTSIGGSAFWGCTALTIYAEAVSKPSGWSSYWNSSNRPVVWDYKNK